MTRTLSTQTTIRIDAPNGPKALALERRLARLDPTAITRGDEWLVELDVDLEQADEVEAAVKQWLAEHLLDETTMYVDGAPRRVRVRWPRATA